MARTIKEIQAEIIAAKEAQTSLSILSSTSATAIWRLWTYIVAVAIFSLETIFDIHKAEVNALILSSKPHTLRWYRQKALDFQFGSDLVYGEDYYDNSALTEDEVNAQKIVSEAAATETDNYVRVKVARELAGELEPVTNSQYNALDFYFSEIKDAGVKLELISQNGDKLKLAMDVYYNPLVLNSDGQRLDGADNEPVQKAIKNYLRNLRFDGEFVVASLVDYVQLVDGVEIPHVVSCQAAKYDNPAFTNVSVKYTPFAGYLRIFNPGDLVLNFIPYD